MNKKIHIVPSFLLLLFSGIVTASPVLSVDVDPLTSGVQSSLTKNIGDSFTVDIVISGVDALAPLNAYEFDLDFNPSVLFRASTTSGSFLPFGFGLPPHSEFDTFFSSIGYAAATIGPGGSSGAGILASIKFDVIGEGISGLDLNDIILSAAFGTPITLGSFNNATIIANPSAVPVPPALLLFVTGLLSTRLFTRKQRCG